MQRSLYYVASYLTGAGLGLVFAPELTLRVLQSNGAYPAPIVRMCGLFVLGLAAFVIQAIRLRLTQLYPTLVLVRVGFCIAYVVIYLQCRDPFFLITLSVVGAGLLASLVGLALAVPEPLARTHEPERFDLEVEANGLRFAAHSWGEGPLVLLLHGFPDTARTWDVIGPAIAKAGYRVVAPYLRGYAPSGLPPRDCDARTLGEDIVALVGALGETEARVIGHDWGAEAAYAAVALAPERFTRLVTIAIPPRAAITITPALFWALRHFIAFKLPGAEARFAANDFAMVEELCRRWSPTWKFTTRDLEHVKNAFAAPGVVHAALGYYRAAKFGTPAFLRTPITVRALAIAGADDPGVSPRVFEAVRGHYRAGYEVATVRGGHFCHRESPEACIAAIVPFLA